ncbi:hypothetical protein LCGC14_2769920, partial [marine sediment metagenome]
ATDTYLFEQVLGDVKLDKGTPDNNFGIAVSCLTRSDDATELRCMYNINTSNLTTLSPKPIILEATVICEVTTNNGAFNDLLHYVEGNWSQGNKNNDPGVGDEITFNNNPCGTNAIIAGDCDPNPDDNITISGTGFKVFNFTNGMRRAVNDTVFNTSFTITPNSNENSADFHVYELKEGNGGCKINVTFELPLDIIPPTIAVDPPTNNTAINAVTLNFTVLATDDTSSEMLCHLRNESEILDIKAVTAGTETNLTYESGKIEIQQTNTYNITCFDNTEPNNNSATVLLNITLDNVFPTIEITLPLNNSIIDKTFKNLTIDALCSDPNAIAFNISLIDSSGNVVSSIQNNSDGSQILIKNVTDISNIPTAKYNLNATCIDGHTYTDSKVKFFTKDDILKKVYYDTLSGNDVSIQMYSST